jgi:hypothetical protein
MLKGNIYARLQEKGDTAISIIGVEKIYYSLQTKDDTTGVTYGAPAYYQGVQEIDIKPKQNTEILYVENILWEQATTQKNSWMDRSCYGFNLVDFIFKTE